MKQLRKAAFRKWLESKGPDEIVGQARKSSGCPFACYLNDGNLRGRYYVGTNYREFYPNREKLTDPFVTPLMPWARQFVKEVDRETGVGAIVASKALKILDSV